MRKSKPLFMGVDIGTQSLRVGVFDLGGRCISSSAHEYPTNFDSNNGATQDPLDWWEAFLKSTRECVCDLNLSSEFTPEDIIALSVCATSSTVIPVTTSGKPLHPALMWMDQRSYGEADHINDTNHPVLRFSGGKVSPEWMVPKMLWLQKNLPEIFAEEVLIVEALDWFNHRLTGEWVVSRCNATCKWNYVSREGGWQDDFFSQIGLADYEQYWPSDVLAVGDFIGQIRPDIAEKLGIPANVRVYQGGIDAHIALLGMGVVQQGVLGIIMGSSFVHLAHSNEPIFAEGLWGPYPDALLEEKWLLEGGQTSGGVINRWFRDNFAIDLQSMGGEAYSFLSEKARKISAGSEGLIVLDFWMGNRTPYRDPHASGNIFGLQMKHTRNHIYRAILEGTAYGTNNVITTMKSANYDVKRLVCCGGGSRDQLWLQIISDVSGLPIQTTEFLEAGILGTAVVAAHGSGYYGTLEEAASNMVSFRDLIEPNFSNSETYNFYFEKYKSLYHKLRDDMHDIARRASG